MSRSTINVHATRCSKVSTINENLTESQMMNVMSIGQWSAIIGEIMRMSIIIYETTIVKVNVRFHIHEWLEFQRFLLWLSILSANACTMRVSWSNWLRLTGSVPDTGGGVPRLALHICWKVWFWAAAEMPGVRCRWQDVGPQQIGPWPDKRSVPFRIIRFARNTAVCHGE